MYRIKNIDGLVQEKCYSSQSSKLDLKLAGPKHNFAKIYIG